MTTPSTSSERLSRSRPPICRGRLIPLLIPAALALSGSACAPREGALIAKTTSPISGPASTTTADPSAVLAPQQHLKVEVDYENGQFRLVQASPVPFPLYKPRGTTPPTGVHFAARLDGNLIHLGTLPDVRTLHGEWVDPATGKMQRKDVPAPGPVRFLIEVPLETEVVDFYDAILTPAPPPNPSMVGARQQPIGTIDLRTHH